MCSFVKQLEDIINDTNLDILDDKNNGTNLTISSNRLIAMTRNTSFASPCMIIVTASYIFGMIGNFIALVHLWQKKNFKNTKHSLMLKCLITNDLIGLSGMFAQMYLQKLLPTDLTEANMKNFCIFRVIWRVFGFSSGCVAFVMALERWLALTKPFIYQKHVTNKLIRKTIFILWTFVAILTFFPLFGFGVYFDEEKKECVRYRDAKDFYDVIYAYILFTVGILLCIGIVICNLSVSKVLYKSHHNMQKKFGSFQTHPSARFISRKSNSFNSFRMMNEPTSDEIRFAKLMTVLSIFFIICWSPQMITVVLTQSLEEKTRKAVFWFFRMADILILIHFVLDPFIYVLSRNDIRLFWRQTFNRKGSKPNMDTSNHLIAMRTNSGLQMNINKCASCASIK